MSLRCLYENWIREIGEARPDISRILYQLRSQIILTTDEVELVESKTTSTEKYVVR